MDQFDPYKTGQRELAIEAAVEFFQEFLADRTNLDVRY
jgi:hypothetical protein